MFRQWADLKGSGIRTPCVLRRAVIGGCLLLAVSVWSVPALATWTLDGASLNTIPAQNAGSSDSNWSRKAAASAARWC